MSDTNRTRGILRDLRIYCTSNGENSGFAAYAYTYRVEDAAGNLVYTNASEKVTEHSGTNDRGYHACLLDWLPKWRRHVLDRLSVLSAEGDVDGGEITAELLAHRTLTIVDSGTGGIFKAYTLPAGELVDLQFRKSSSEFIGNAAWVARVLAEAEEMGVTITCRQPATIHETAELGAIRKVGKKRWMQAVAARMTMFVA